MERHMYFDYIYIDDLIQIIDWFLFNEPAFHRYNVCTGQQHDLFELAEMIRNMIDCDIPIILKDGEWKTPYTGDNTRLTTEMGKLSFTPIHKAVEEMILFYQKNGFVDKYSKTCIESRK